MDKLQELISAFEPVAAQMPCILVADSKGCYAYVNEGWCRHLGYRPEEVLGKKVHNFAPGTRVDEVLATGKAVIGYNITGSSGDRLFNNCLPLFDGDQIIGAVVFTFFTTTEEAVGFSKTIRELTSQIDYYKDALSRLQGAHYSIDNIIGKSAAIRQLKDQIREASRTMSTVLIEGETGCGKELVANAIHDLSGRRDKPLIKLNCSAIPPELVESELFGYEGGAFTGASRQGKKGYFEAADTGSLFLDEINQMAYHVQPKLLRVLQEREVVHVGGSRSVPVDVRIIAASNRPLHELVAEEKFREDLYYRLNVVNIHIPPLRERLEDIPDLIEGLRVRLNRTLGMHVDGFNQEVEERLQQYDWPGNVRELNNVVERAMNHHMQGVLTWDDFRDYFEMRKVSARKENTLRRQKAKTEEALIRETLEKYRYNKTKTAQALGISRTMLYQKLGKYGI